MKMRDKIFFLINHAGFTPDAATDFVENEPSESDDFILRIQKEIKETGIVVPPGINK